MITKKQVKEIMNRHLIISSGDLEDSFNFVSEMLELLADDTEQNEPYAVHSIDRYRNAASEVWSMGQEMIELIEKEDE